MILLLLEKPDFMRVLLSFALCILLLHAKAQPTQRVTLEKMPEALETDFALSALPPHLRSAATVWLLNPLEGYYIARKGTNGFVCFISRTEWEWGEFRNDLAVPMSYDAEGAKTVFKVYKDVAAMRASGKYSAMQVRDAIAGRIKKGIYKAPSKGGISYMLAPVMRAYQADPGNKNIVTVSVPHYMFYAPYITDTDLGVSDDSQQGFIPANPGNYVLGKGKGPFGIIITPVGHEQKMAIVEGAAELLKRLAGYKPYFAVQEGGGHH